MGKTIDANDVAARFHFVLPDDMSEVIRLTLAHGFGGISAANPLSGAALMRSVEASPTDSEVFVISVDGKRYYAADETAERDYRKLTRAKQK